MDTEELKRLAEANYGWKSADSAWLHTSNDGSAIVGNIDDEHNPQIHNPVAVVDVTQYDGFEGDSLELANFYAAANPAAILELIRQRDELLVALKGVERAFRPIPQWHGTNWHAQMMRALESKLLEREALKDARELVDDWGAYAPAYMQEKHDLAGDLDRLDAAIAKAEAKS